MDNKTSKSPTARPPAPSDQSRDGLALNQQLAVESQKLRLDRQKHTIEILLKRYELRKIREKNTWKETLSNPVIIAAVGGILSILTAIVTNYLSSQEARRTNAAQVLLTEKSAKEALEADLIKKFVENPRTDAVRENLKFLVDAGLIPSYADGIRMYLETNPNVAPQIGVEFSPSGVSLSDDVRKKLQREAARFAIYLQNLGFPGLEQNVSVFIYSEDRSPPNMPGHLVNAFYVNETIFIHQSLTRDVSVALREYAHHALFKSLGSPAEYHQNEIESALSDYLPASFLNSPIRSLDSDAPYESSSSSPIRRGAAWAAALWACRGRVSQQAVDGMILPAWRKAMSDPVDDNHVAKEFQRALTTAALPLGSCLSEELHTRMIPDLH